MPRGHKTITLRGGVDENDFPMREIALKDIRKVGIVAWEKWRHMVADWPMRDLIALAYAEGLYHGAMIGTRDTTGSSQSGASSVAASVLSSATTETPTLSVRDLLDSM